MHITMVKRSFYSGYSFHLLTAQQAVRYSNTFTVKGDKELADSVLQVAVSENRIIFELVSCLLKDGLTNILKQIVDDIPLREQYFIKYGIKNREH